MKRLAVLVSIFLAVAPPVAHAAPGDGDLDVDRPLSLTFSLSTGAAYLLSEAFFKEGLAPGSCRWCDPELNAIDSGVREALVWDDVRTARHMSDGLGFGVVPVVGLGALALSAWSDDREGQIVDDGLIVFEAIAAAGILNQLVKFIVARERPFVRYIGEDNVGLAGDPPDRNLSFYSGHTSLTFSIAVSSGTIATLRGYRGAPWIWASGLTLAGLTGYLRIAGDKHYFSDVMTGAVIGSFVGFAVPYWLHRGDDGPEAPEPTSAPLAGWNRGPMLSWGGVF